jgi:hypothetical protein
VTGYIGGFGDYTGFRFEKPRPVIPCGAWAVGNYRGFWGFISTTGKFKKNDHSSYLDHHDPLKKNIQRPKKNHKNPKNPVFAIRPGGADGPQYDNVMKTLYGEQQCLLAALCGFGDG